jgi:hypothetical protein
MLISLSIPSHFSPNTFLFSFQVLTVTVDKYFTQDKFYETLPNSTTPATIAQFGRLHMVYNANLPKWGNPNISFIE